MAYRAWIPDVLVVAAALALGAGCQGTDGATDAARADVPVDTVESGRDAASDPGPSDPGLPDVIPTDPGQNAGGDAAEAGPDTGDEGGTDTGDAGPSDPGTDPGTLGLPHGAACTEHAECAGGFCAGTEEHPFFVGGYCTALCDPALPECGDGAACFDLADAGMSFGLCVRRCDTDTDCRPPDYVCGGSCIPGGFGATVPESGTLTGAEVDLQAAMQAFDSERLVGRLATLSGEEPWNGPGGVQRILSRNRAHPGHAIALDYLESELKAAGAATQRVDLWIDGEKVTDLVADLPSTDRSAAPILVGAHYDSTASHSTGWVAATGDAPGASDNATGAAIALEIASVLGRGGLPRSGSPVRIVLFDGEEEGLLGARAWLAEGMGAGTCLLNVDMVGAAPEAMGGRFWFQFDQDLDTALPALGWEAIHRFVPEARPVATAFTDTGGSDSNAFWDEGECSVALISWPRMGTNHTSDDRFAGIDGAFFQRVARAAVAVAAAWSR